jgi:hypothetical protein
MISPGRDEGGSASLHLVRVASSVVLALLLTAAPVAQILEIDPLPLPPLPGLNRIEDVELGDVDLDGDLDVVVGRGGEVFPEQSRLLINTGGLQGGALGTFVDETAARLPASIHKTFDVDLADVDADGDLDLHVSNTIWGGLDTSRWWLNQGGVQGGSAGYFADETAACWVGLGEPGSSIPPSFVFAGSFIDNSHGADFGDVDGDGDLDLVHSSYVQPTRVFLNDGSGRFSELNPSGFQPSSDGLAEGDPGLWCEGLQTDKTMDVTGALCDVKAFAQDLELFDADGDLDLDLLLSEAYSKLPRFFANRLEPSFLVPAEPSGALVFRDVTGHAFAGWTSPSVAPRGEDVGDLDGDGDLDIFGANWAAVFPLPLDTAVVENAGGVFAAPQVVPASGSEHEEADLADIDGDGDLDALLSGANPLELFENLGGLAFLAAAIPDVPASGHCAAVGDLDGDGDLDVLLGGSGVLRFYRNVTEAPDVTPPRVPLVEALGDAAAVAGERRVRAHVLDDASPDLVRFSSVGVDLAVDGVALPDVTARWGGGQVFGAPLPANLVGQVEYRFVAEDHRGNEGASAWQTYTGSTAAAFQVPYGVATVGSTGGAPDLRALSAPLGGTTLHLALASGAPAGTAAIVGIGTAPLDPGVPVPGLLFLQIAGVPLATAALQLDGGGEAVSSLALPASLPSGVTVFAQGFVLDPTPAGELLASSRGLALTTQ